MSLMLQGLSMAEIWSHKYLTLRDLRTKIIEGLMLLDWAVDFRALALKDITNAISSIGIDKVQKDCMQKWIEILCRT